MFARDYKVLFSSGTLKDFSGGDNPHTKLRSDLKAGTKSEKLQIIGKFSKEE
jgi:hypothetical protein